MTSSANPWNEVYKLVACKRKNNTQITTLRKPNGILTADIRETLKHMLDYFTPEDKETDDSTINSSEHKLKIPRTLLMTKTSP